MAGLVSVVILKEGSRAVENRYTVPILPSWGGEGGGREGGGRGEGEERGEGWREQKGE